jgi:hypothetical protein
MPALRIAAEECVSLDRLRSVGRSSARAATSVAGWTGDRVGDLATWAVHLIRDLPVRAGRLALTVWAGVLGVVTLAPAVARAWRAGRWAGLRAWAWAALLRTGGWLATLVTRLLDLCGLPELLDFIWRTASHMSPLTGAEIAAASRVLGPTALRWGDVRVAQGGLLGLWYRLRGDRAFNTFYTVNLPRNGPHARENLDILIHELVHVYQYERIGSVYGVESLYAQRTSGYDYGGREGLRQAQAEGKHFCTFNREQQAQIVQDYYDRLCHGLDTTDYEPFIVEVQAGKFNA